MPGFDAGWDIVAQLNIGWPFQLPNPFSSSPGQSQSIHQQLSALILAMLPVPEKDFADR